MKRDPRQAVSVERDEGVWVLTFDRPQVNAIDLAVASALADALAEAADAPSCRAIVITGEGRAFSAGIDTRVVPAYDTHARREMLRTINRTATELYGVAKPTVAAINGHALGAGLVVALACDLRLAASGEYRLGLTEVTAGIPFPAVPMLIVRSELERNDLRALTLTGMVFGPGDAPASRFLDEVVPPAELRRQAIRRAGELARAPAYAAVKSQLKGATLEHMRRIVEREEEPMLERWIPSGA